jgi:hypothetical protein
MSNILFVIIINTAILLSVNLLCIKQFLVIRDGKFINCLSFNPVRRVRLAFSLTTTFVCSQLSSGQLPSQSLKKTLHFSIRILKFLFEILLCLLPPTLESPQKALISSIRLTFLLPGGGLAPHDLNSS